MKDKKKIRTKGKLKLSRYFQEFKNESRVAIVRESSVQPRFPKILQGRTGKVEGKKGKSFIVGVNLNGKNKKYLIEPIHLKKIE